MQDCALESARRGSLEAPAHCAECAVRLAACTCANCSRCLRLITWYGQTPGNVLTRSARPQLQQWAKGVDLQAILRSKRFYTTAFTQKYVQWAVCLLGLAQLFAAARSGPQKLMADSTAKCAMARVTPHSLRNGEQVPASVNRTDWDFGLLYNGCTVPMGQLSGSGVTRQLIFAEPVEFNGYYLTSRTAQRDLDDGFDPASFTLECLSGSNSTGTGIGMGTGTGGAVTLAASGSCGWFAAVHAAHVVKPPPTAWRVEKNHFGEDEMRATHDYSEQKFMCKLPMLFDHLSQFSSGGSFLLAGVQALYFADSGISGVKVPLHTVALGGLLSSAFIIIICLLSWQTDNVLIAFHLSRIVNLICFVSEQFPEENFVFFGLSISLLGVWDFFFPSFEGTAHTTFYESDQTDSMVSIAARCVSVRACMYMRVPVPVSVPVVRAPVRCHCRMRFDGIM